MPHHRPDSALNRAVLDLGRLHPEDAALVLDALAPSDRARIEAILSGKDGERTATAAKSAESDQAWAYEGVSPWLLARIDPSAKGGRRKTEFVLLTDAARTALVAAAEPFRTPRVPSGPGQSLVSRIWEKLGGRPA